MSLVASRASTREHRVANGDGWELPLFQTIDEERLDASRNPVLIVPGYGMNSFIFSFHPSGFSLEGYLAHAGFEVWRADLREQGTARALGAAGGSRDARSSRYGLADLAVTDVGAVVDAVIAGKRSRGDRVDTIGASLGGSLMFAHIALTHDHALGSLVAIGSPVRWVDVHPMLRVAFASESIAGSLPLRGTRALARLALPLLAEHAPGLLGLYMNPTITDTRAAAEMTRTVEDPNRHVNREIARWIRERDLVLRGVNVTEALATIRAPFLCVSALADAIVPPRTAAFPYEAIGSPVKKLLEVGTRELAMSHADLFVSRESEGRVFEPLARWLMDPTS